MGGELAVELPEQRDAIGETKLGAGGGERGVLRRCRAIDDEIRAGQRLEGGGERGVAHPVVRPGQTRAQGQHRVAVERGNMVEAGAEDCHHMRYPAPELIINHQRRRGECAIVRINAEVGSVFEA